MTRVLLVHGAFHDLGSDHDPFLSCPAELAAVLALKVDRVTGAVSTGPRNAVVES